VRIESMNNSGEGNFSFVEATSPWQAPLLTKGNYQVIVRAYDKAGNMYDGEATFEIHKDIITSMREHGLRIGPCVLPLWIAMFIPLIILVVLLVVLRVLRKRFIDPSSQLTKHLRELRQRVKGRRRKLTKELSEEKEIKKVLEKELNNNLSEKELPSEDKT